MIAVDTNIIAYLLIKGENTPKAMALLDRERDWVVPSFWRIEFLNILVNYSRHQKMPAEDIRAVWKASFQLSHLREEPVEGDQALDLALRHKISGYDALFVALAKTLGMVCVTCDKALRKAVPQLTVGLDEYLK